jgi:hypothetical protein
MASLARHCVSRFRALEDIKYIVIFPVCMSRFGRFSPYMVPLVYSSINSKTQFCCHYMTLNATVMNTGQKKKNYIRSDFTTPVVPPLAEQEERAANQTMGRMSKQPLPDATRLTHGWQLPFLASATFIQLAAQTLRVPPWPATAIHPYIALLHHKTGEPPLPQSHHSLNPTPTPKGPFRNFGLYSDIEQDFRKSYVFLWKVY